MSGYRRVAARDELRSKTMHLAPAELSAPDPRQVLRKRLCDEMDALRGILRKAEIVVRKTVAKGRAGAAPRRGKDGCFLAVEARSEAIDEVDHAPSAKRRKAMPPVEIIEPLPRTLKAGQIPIPCFKKRRTTPPLEIIEPRISKDEIIEEGEIIEKGEFIEPDCGATATTLDTCGGVVTRKGLCSPPRILEDGEMTEEEGVICGDAALVATAETAKCPSNSSSSGSSSSSNGSSGSSSCSDTSDSNSSDSDDSDDECVTSNVAHAVVPIPKTDASAMLAKRLCSPPRKLEDGEMTEEEEEVDICGDASPIATDKFVETAESPSSSCSSLSGSSSSGSSSSSCSSGSSDSDSSDSSSDHECVTSNPAPVLLPKTNAVPMAMPPKILSPITEEEFAETRNSRRSNGSLLEDGEIEEEQESRGASPMAAEKFAEPVNSTVSANAQCVRSSLAPAVSPEPSKPQPAAQGTVRHFCARGFEKKRERAAAAQDTVRHFYTKAFEKKRERQRAYEKLEEMERNAKEKPIFEWIHPGHLRQLGITTEMEYAVTSERRFPARRGSPVQSLLGLFLKAE